MRVIWLARTATESLIWDLRLKVRHLLRLDLFGYVRRFRGLFYRRAANVILLAALESGQREWTVGPEGTSFPLLDAVGGIRGCGAGSKDLWVGMARRILKRWPALHPKIVEWYWWMSHQGLWRRLRMVRGEGTSWQEIKLVVSGQPRLVLARFEKDQVRFRVAAEPAGGG